MTLVWDRILSVQVIINISSSSNNNDGDDNDDDSGNNDDSVSIKDDCYSLSLQAIIMMTLSLLSLLSVGEPCKCYGMHLFFRFVYCCVRSFIICCIKNKTTAVKLFILHLIYLIFFQYSWIGRSQRKKQRNKNKKIDHGPFAKFAEHLF